MPRSSRPGQSFARDGAVVFLGTATSGEWSITIDRERDRARCNGGGAAAWPSATRPWPTVSWSTPYLIEVVVRGQLIQPVVYRERIRAFGPSIDARAPDRLSA